MKLTEYVTKLRTCSCSKHVICHAFITLEKYYVADQLELGTECCSHPAAEVLAEEKEILVSGRFGPLLEKMMGAETQAEMQAEMLITTSSS